MCGIDPAGLAATVERFNEHARNGVDPDFGRGESAYNRSLGDPRRGLHPCLGPIDEAPYYAVQMLPSDIGTCGGLVTDEAGRVLDESGAPIAGLYATGNSTATVMGRHYLGPGASIANSMVFGYLAARQVAPRGDRNVVRRVGARHQRTTFTTFTGEGAPCHLTTRRPRPPDFEHANFFRDRAIQDDPYDYFDWVRQQGPVWREPNFGVFMITGHPEAMQIYGDPATFPEHDAASGRFSSCNVVTGPFQKFSEPIEGDDVTDVIVRCRDELTFSDQLPAFDPPNHTAHRHLLMRLITPKNLKENEDFMWDYADVLIDRFVGDGTFEVVSQYAEPFTLTVVADLEGVPEADHELFRERLSTVHEHLEHKPLEFLYGKFSEYIADRRREPRNDILTGLGDGDVPRRFDTRGERRRAARRQPVRRRPGDDRAAVVVRPADARREPRPAAGVARRPRAGSPTSSRRRCAWRARCGRSSAWRGWRPNSAASRSPPAAR